jgi:hypothetical protein
LLGREGGWETRLADTMLSFFLAGSYFVVFSRPLPQQVNKRDGREDGERERR